MAKKEEMLKETKIITIKILNKHFMKEGRKQTWEEVREMLGWVKKSLREIENGTR